MAWFSRMLAVSSPTPTPAPALPRARDGASAAPRQSRNYMPAMMRRTVTPTTVAHRAHTRPSCPKKPVVFAPTDNDARHRLLKLHQWSVRDPKITRSRPTKQPPFLPAVSSLRDFRTPAAEPAGPSRKRPASEILQHSGRPG